MLIEYRQVRAARALLDWSEEQLALKAGISMDVLSGIETGAADAQPQTLQRIQAALETEVEFLMGTGVRMRSADGVPDITSNVVVLQGPDAYWGLLDDMYHTLMQDGGEACVLGIDETRVAAALGRTFTEGGEKLSRHINRLQRNHLRCRKIIREGDFNIIAPLSWYRSIPTPYFSPHPLYIYGNKIAILHMGASLKAVIYEKPDIARSLQKLFNFIWERCSPLELRQSA